MQTIKAKLMIIFAREMRRENTNNRLPLDIRTEKTTIEELFSSSFF